MKFEENIRFLYFELIDSIIYYQLITMYLFLYIIYRINISIFHSTLFDIKVD